MDILRLIFPFSFNTRDIPSLIVKLVIYIVAGAVVGTVIGLLSSLPIIGIIGVFAGLIELYVTLGVVLTILNFLDII